MFGFLTKSKSKSKATETSTQAPAPQVQDGLKDSLSDPLAQSAQKPPEEAQAQPQKAQRGPGLLDRLFKTQAFKDSKRAEATQKASAMPAKVILEKYWKEAYAFAISEQSPENFDFYDAVKGGVTKSSIYNVWIDPKADNYINIPGKVRNPLMEMAAKGQFDQMDFADAFRECEGNIGDTLSRFKISETFINAVMSKG